MGYGWSMGGVCRVLAPAAMPCRWLLVRRVNINQLEYLQAAIHSGDWGRVTTKLGENSPLEQFCSKPCGADLHRETGRHRSRSHAISFNVHINACPHLICDCVVVGEELAQGTQRFGHKEVRIHIEPAVLR